MSAKGAEARRQATEQLATLSDGAPGTAPVLRAPFKSCCGQARAQAMLEAKRVFAQPPRPETIAFEYIGQTSLSVIGPVTRATYRFQAKGIRLAVDPRDAAGLASVRILRRV
jgi:hypothetical protein